jgi:hypothetical protein
VGKETRLRVFIDGLREAEERKNSNKGFDTERRDGGAFVGRVWVRFNKQVGRWLEAMKREVEVQRDDSNLKKIQ